MTTSPLRWSGWPPLSKLHVPRVVAGSALLVGALLACSAGFSRSTGAPSPGTGSLPRVRVRTARGEQLIRVALAGVTSNVRVSATGDWMLYEPDGRAPLARGRFNVTWRFERAGHQIRGIDAEGVPTDWEPRAIVVRVIAAGEFLTVNGRRYRGELRVMASDTGIVVVDRLTVEEYLRGVVPLEMGQRDARDLAALQAQAVTARSYAFAHLSEDPTKDYDVTGGELDQVYGGADAENLISDSAIQSTAGYVLSFGGRAISAPYHASCGGSTAEAPEVWHSPGEPYLQRVSDRIAGTDRYYCDIGPRFQWSSTLSAAEINESVSRYLKAYVAVPGGQPGTVRQISIMSHTPSGRVGAVEVRTDRGAFVLHGNDMRYVLRPPGGEILNSTYFSLEPETAANGALVRLLVRGRGHGHGVGMCQWGAIGRARAGQDFWTILRAYYPGTTVAVAN
jgi:stage II sporulation protein D